MISLNIFRDIIASCRVNTRILNLFVEQFLHNISLALNGVSEANLNGREQVIDISVLESEIDSLVYQLYGLTIKEIKIVEGKESNTHSKVWRNEKYSSSLQMLNVVSQGQMRDMRI